ncbi:MAG TPA: glutamate--tRNA ligase [Sedimentisphaerales bacterium]|nr:glutamate--tRNA ligase [Sedimentisphaerales bacterium]
MVVTRFAPSPTGYLHIGGARTALFNWLYARKTAGQFILRIEDTDVKRNTPTAVKQVIADLRWLGIDWDQGPEIGGPAGPYLQSQRKHIYDEYINRLINDRKAYYCFDTPDELKAMRDTAAAQKQNFRYPRPETFPDRQDVKKALDEGREVTVRSVMPETEITVNDLIRGPVTFGADEFGDFIIQKSDGFPTYHFACVVDDELMAVTDIIRGQEHLMNTPCHQALQDALGFRRPRYAHMSVTVSQGGGKLSKRERAKTLRDAIKARPDIDRNKLAAAGNITVEELNTFIEAKTWPDMPAVDAMAGYLGVQLPEVNVVDFFKSGYIPEAMVNFLALLGWNPGDQREIMPLEELVNAFDISRLTKANSFFDRQKLVAFNTEHIRMVDSEKLLRYFRDFLNVVGSVVTAADDVTLRRLLQICTGAKTLADIERKSRFLFLQNSQIEYDDEAVSKVLLKNDGLAVLQQVRHGLAGLEPFTKENIELMLRTLAESKQLQLGRVAQPLRVAICGSTISPPIFDSVYMLGRENTLARIDRCLKTFVVDR